MKTIQKQIGLALLLVLNAFTLKSQKFSTDALSKVDSIFKTAFEENAPGGALAIIQNGEVLYQNFRGLANLEHGIPVTDATVFNIASNSKHMTTFLAFMMAEEGMFSFEDDIREHLPELTHLEHKITIKQLTNHTHGLPNVDELAQFKGLEKTTHDQLLDMLLEIKTFNFSPGDNYVYSNTGFVLLSEIISRKGKKPFEALLREYLFNPLGMTSEAVGNFSQIVPNLAESYSQIQDDTQKNVVTSSTMGASGVHTNLNDLIVWSKNFYNTQVGKPAYWKKMTEPTMLNSGKTIEYGMGLQFENYKGIDIVFHGGGKAGYRSYILHVPQQNLSLVYMSNGGGFSGLDVVYGSLEALMADLIVPENKPAPHDTPLSDYEGTYQLNPGAYYTILAEKDSLFWQAAGTNERLFLPRVNSNTFTFPVIPFTKLKFYEDRFDFRISDFNYPSPRVDLPLDEKVTIDPKRYVGIYENKAYNILYELIWENGKLKARFPNDNEVILDAYSETSVYAKNSFFGKLDFSFDANGNVSGFILSRQNLTNVPFVKR